MSQAAARPTAPSAVAAPEPEQPAFPVTPMMAQYLGIKAQHPDCLLFYRMGDFYELFLEDAEIAARALNIVLTKRGKHQGADIAMCGVPVDRSDDYLHRLIALGHRVAVCEQVEDPAEAKKRGGKSVVQRAVVRLVTPGTITEDRLLDPAQANALVALARIGDGADAVFGLASVDISTGTFQVAETAQAGLAGLLARLEPRELVLPEALHRDREIASIVGDVRAAVTPVAREYAETSLAERRLREWYGVETLDGFGRLSPAEIAAAATAVAYVTRTQVGARPHLQPPARIERGAAMEIDPATRTNLELVRTLTGDRAGSLLGSVDLTVTAAGGRLLASRVAAPLVDSAAIAGRLDAVDWAVANAGPRSRVRAALKAAPDLARALSRLALDRGGPRDLAAVRDALLAAEAVRHMLIDTGPLPEAVAAYANAAGQVDAALRPQLAAALADELPLNKRDGGFVRAGQDAGLDEARALRDDTRQVIAALQGRYADETGVRGLRVKHNSFLGYYIEVPQSVGEAWLRPPENARFIHRQSMAGAMRFATTELAELDARIASAADQAQALELAIFDDAAGCGAGRSQRASGCLRRAGRHRRGHGAGRACGEPWLEPAGRRRQRRLHDPGRPPSGGGSRAEDPGQELCRERLRSRWCCRSRRPDRAGHRPEHGGQIHLPPPERPDRDPGPGRFLRARDRGPDRCRRPSVLARRAPPTIWRAGARPSWSRWWRRPQS